MVPKMPLALSASSIAFTAAVNSSMVGRHLDAVLLEQVLAVHQDEDRDVEGNADHLAVVHRDALDQRLGEVVPVEARHREIGLATCSTRSGSTVSLGEGRHPGLVEIVEVVGAELALHVLRRLGEHLLERHDLDLDFDAGRVGELVLDLVDDDGRRRRFRGVADLGALELAADLLQPLLDVVRGLGGGQRRCRYWSGRRTAGRWPRKAAGEAREADAGQRHPAQELALGDPPLGEGARRVGDEGLPVVVLKAHGRSSSVAGLGGRCTRSLLERSQGQAADEMLLHQQDEDEARDDGRTCRAPR